MSKQLTPWFSMNTKPVHVGVYQTDFLPYDDYPGYSWWNGEGWGQQHSCKELAGENRRPNGEQCKKWRGLAKKP